MKKISLTFLLIQTMLFSIGQLKFNSYVFIKKEMKFNKAGYYDSLYVKKGEMIPGDKLYSAERVIGNSFELLIPGTDYKFKMDTSKVVRVDRLPAKERVGKIKKYLYAVDKKYKEIDSLSKLIPGYILNGDTLDYRYYARDSIYENYYSPVREEIVKAWLKYKDINLLSAWLDFLYRNGSGDDGLDSKYLTICFLKSPGEFSGIIRKQNEKLRSYITGYMLNSTGFLYATNTLNLDYEKSRKLFISSIE